MEIRKKKVIFQTEKVKLNELEFILSNNAKSIVFHNPFNINSMHSITLKEIPLEFQTPYEVF